jgi:hypothetical protein
MVVAVAADAAGGWRQRSVRGAQSIPTILLGLTVLLLLISAAAFPDRTRPDMLVYGRYTEIVAPPLIAIGLAILAAGRLRPRLGRPLLGFALLTGLIVLVRFTSSDPGAANRWNVSSLPFLTFELGPGVLIGAGLVAAAGAWLLFWTARRHRRALPAAAIGLLLAVVAYGVWNPVRSSELAAYPNGWISPEPVAERYAIRTVAYDADHYDVLGLYPPQWLLPETSFELFHGDHRPPPSRYVLGTASWNAEHPRQPATAIWRDADRDQVLWRLTRR